MTTDDVRFSVECVFPTHLVTDYDADRGASTGQDKGVIVNQRSIRRVSFPGISKTRRATDLAHFSRPTKWIFGTAVPKRQEICLKHGEKLIVRVIGALFYWPQVTPT